MDAEIPQQLLEQIQAITEVEGEEFLDFVKQIIASSSREIVTIEDLQAAIVQFIAEQTLDEGDQGH